MIWDLFIRYDSYRKHCQKALITLTNTSLCPILKRPGKLASSPATNGWCARKSSYHLTERETLASFLIRPTPRPRTATIPPPIRGPTAASVSHLVKFTPGTNPKNKYQHAAPNLTLNSANTPRTIVTADPPSRYPQAIASSSHRQYPRWSSYSPSILYTFCCCCDLVFIF